MRNYMIVMTEVKADVIITGKRQSVLGEYENAKSKTEKH